MIFYFISFMLTLNLVKGHDSINLATWQQMTGSCRKLKHLFETNYR